MCIGPFFSDYKNNDASILKHRLNKNEQDIITWLHKDDILIVDRGFWDAAPAIKHFGYATVMPSFLNKRQQPSIEDANYTCLVTKVPEWSREVYFFSFSLILSFSIGFF